MELKLYLTFLSVLQFNAYGILVSRVSEKKCDDYRKMFSPIVEEFNDEVAVLKEFPFMARVQNDTHYCNGILISENFVLSTADGNDLKTFITLGDVDREKSNDDARLQRFDIVHEITHPQFNTYNLSSNIRLLKLNGTVKFDEYVRPACLSQPESEISQQLLQIGWGVTNIRSNYRLHKVQLNYVPDKNCTETYSAYDRTKYILDITSGHIFCAEVNKGNREMCVGFSGSALLNKRHDSMDEIMGIASLQSRCNSTYPKVFVRVASYIDWIESIVWPNETVSDIIHTESTLMSHTTKTTTTEASTRMKAETSERPTPYKQDITTESSSTTTKLPLKERPKSLDLKYIIIIVAVLFLMLVLLLCVAVSCLCFKSRNTQNVNVSVQYTCRN